VARIKTILTRRQKTTKIKQLGIVICMAVKTVSNGCGVPGRRYKDMPVKVKIMNSPEKRVVVKVRRAGWQQFLVY
jgi:hypothetical protein